MDMTSRAQDVPWTSLIWLVLVGFLWGFTTPFIKRASKGIERVKEDNFIRQFMSEIKFLFFNWKYALPLMLNQSGSFIYTFSLSKTPLSIAVPTTNAFNFIFVLVAGRWTGEASLNKTSMLGLLTVMTGIALCISSKVTY